MVVTGCYPELMSELYQTRMVSDVRQDGETRLETE